MIQNPSDRLAALKGFDNEMKDLDRETSTTKYQTLTMIAGRAAKGPLLGSRLSLMLMPAVQEMSKASMRGEASRLLLYSFGANGADDNGSLEHSGDDWSVEFRIKTLEEVLAEP